MPVQHHYYRLREVEPRHQLGEVARPCFVVTERVPTVKSFCDQLMIHPRTCAVHKPVPTCIKLTQPFRVYT